MIFQDDKKVSVPSAFVKNFTKPVVYELHPGILVQDHNTGKTAYPVSYAIETRYNIMDKGTTIEYRYAEHATPRIQGGMSVMHYSPDLITFNSRGQIILDPANSNHVDLHYWLSNHPSNASSFNFDKTKKAKFILIDNQKEAAAKVKVLRDKHESERYILGEWDEPKLREIARGFDVPRVDDLSVEEIQETLIGVMATDPSKFLDRCMSHEMVLRAQIGQAVELGVLAYNDKTSTWSWGEKTSKHEAEICKVRHGEDAKDRLIKYMRQAVKDENIEYLLDRLSDAIEMKNQDVEAKSIEISKMASKRAGLKKKDNIEAVAAVDDKD